MNEPFRGTVTGDILEIRFPFAGKVVSITKHPGDAVRKGELLASLDRRILQTELDRQLADYEKTRAEFELFQLKTANLLDDVTKYGRQEKQAALNAAVKDIELAKYKLDQADLTSPVSGVVWDTGTMAPHMYVTPAGNPISVCNHESLRFTFTVPQAELYGFVAPLRIRLRIPGLEKEFSGTSVPPQWGSAGTFTVIVRLDDTAGLLPGMNGEARIIV